MVQYFCPLPYLRPIILLYYKSYLHFRQPVSLFPVNCPCKHCQVSIPYCVHTQAAYCFSKRKHIFPGVRPLFTNLCYWLYSSFHTLIAVIEKWIILLSEGEARWRDSTLQDKCMRDPSFGTAIQLKEKTAAKGRVRESEREMATGETHDVFPFSSCEESRFTCRFSGIWFLLFFIRRQTGQMRGGVGRKGKNVTLALYL